MNVLQPLDGEERKKFIKTLQSQLVSCVLLDGKNGVTDRLLISRLKEHWGLNISDVYQKLGIKSINDLLKLYENKFYMVHDVFYLSSMREDNGVKEIVELIKNTNEALRENKLAADKKYRHVPTARPTFSYSSHPQLRAFMQQARGTASTTQARGPLAMPASQSRGLLATSRSNCAPLAKTRFFYDASVPPPRANASSATNEPNVSKSGQPSSSNCSLQEVRPPRLPTGFNAAIPSDLISSKPKREPIYFPTSPIREESQSESDECEILDELKVEQFLPSSIPSQTASSEPLSESNKPAAMNRKATDGFKSFVLSQVMGKKSAPGALAHSSGKSVPSSILHVVKTSKQPEWEEVEEAFSKFLTFEEKTGTTPFEEEE